MVHVLIRHKVSDFTRWMSVFDAAHDLRKAGGELSTRLFRTPDQPHEVNLLCEWESLEQARKFFHAQNLKMAMRQAGVVGQPHIEYMEEIHIVHRTSAD